MSIDVSHALRNEGTAYPFGEELDLGVIPFETGDFRTDGITKIEGELTAMDGEIFAKGEITTTLSRLCDRCGEGYTRTYVLSFEETFTRNHEDDDSDNYSFENEEIDFERMVQDCIVLQTPTASLCSDDCRGLCPICGVNLNSAQCNCVANDQIGPFGVLAGFVDRDKED